MIDTHTHLDGEEFKDDILETIERASIAGINEVYLPAIDLQSCHGVIDMAKRINSMPYGVKAYTMLGIHPEEVRTDWQEQLSKIKEIIDSNLAGGQDCRQAGGIIAIGEVGLDYYWSREFEHEQLEAFERQVQWSIETRLPLMIHCRKAQNEMVRMLRPYAKDLPGGVFHCFTGNEHEAEELLEFDRFVLGIGGVLTFKKSNLPETLAHAVPLDRIVLETDSPYMAPVPMRGKRNEPAYVAHVCNKLAEVYGVTPTEVDRITTDTAHRVFLPHHFSLCPDEIASCVYT